VLLVVVNFDIESTVHAKVYGLLLLNDWLFLVVHALVNCDVHFVNEDAISWHTISLVNIHNISNNEFPNRNTLNGSKCSPAYCNLLVIDLVFETQELSLLDPIAETSDEGTKHDTRIDCERLNISRIRFLRTEN